MSAVAGTWVPGSGGAVPIFEVKEATRRYGSVDALKGVSVSVRRGEILGLCGHNGAGKSTLVKVLAGLERPDSGSIFVSGQSVEFAGVHDAQRAGVALVDQELSLVPDLTVAENIFLGRIDQSIVLRREAMRRQTRELLDLLGLQHVEPDTLVADLPIGERQLVEIARVLGREAELLILDEPTATLSDAEIERVFSAVRGVVEKRRAGVIFVSHRLDEVLELCSQVSVLRDGRNVASRPVGDLTKDELVELMLGPEGRSAAGIPARVQFAERSEGGDISVRMLRVGSRVRGFDLDIRAGTVVGLAGQVGCGASEILAALAGLEPDVDGAVRIGDHLVRLGSPLAAQASGIHYVSNDRKAQGLFLSQSLANNLVATRLSDLSTLGVLRLRSIRRKARSLAELVDVDPKRLPVPVRLLSGGNQQKVFVGRCLEHANLSLLILDEPTRGVDVGGRAGIHELVRQVAAQGYAVIIFSTELEEVLELSDHVVTLFAGRVVSRLERAQATAGRVFRDITNRTSVENAQAPG